MYLYFMHIQLSVYVHIDVYAHTCLFPVTTIQFDKTSYTATEKSSSVEVTITATSDAPPPWKKLNTTSLADLVKVSGVKTGKAFKM